MGTRKYRKLLCLLLLIVIGSEAFFIHREYQSRLGAKEEVSSAMSKELLIPGGMPIGIYMETEGVMVLGTETVKGADGIRYEPAYNLIRQGDYIVGLDDFAITNKKELISAVGDLDGGDIVLHVKRGANYLDVKMNPIRTKGNQYMLGIWVRDNAQGLGTITFLTSKSEYGALGHGIHDTDTNELLNISDGSLYETSIKDIKKGISGSPGGMEGIIIYNKYNLVGTIEKNTEAGIFGKVDKVDAVFVDQEPMEIGTKTEIKEGQATIRCNVNNEIKDYDIRITKIDLTPREINKGIVIEVIDEELLEITGGIVQGMSGSPIIQNNKIIGAVTHVFVQDASKGYGIFIENMLENVK